MIDIIVQSIRQAVLPQRIQRIPEPRMVMADREEAAQYDQGTDFSSLNALHELVLYKLVQIAPEKGEALDIASGSGKLLCKMAAEFPGLKFTGTDLSDEMLALAQKNIKAYPLSNVHLQKLNMHELASLKGRRFDLITFNIALHHCETSTQAVEIIRQANQLLTDKGILFIFDLVRPKTDDICIWTAKRFNNRWGRYFYEDALNSERAAFTFKECETLIKESGWKNYVHIQPPLASAVQIIHTATPLRKIDRKPNLRTLDQKMVYYTQLPAFKA